MRLPQVLEFSACLEVFPLPGSDGVFWVAMGSASAAFYNSGADYLFWNILEWGGAFPALGHSCHLPLLGGILTWKDTIPAWDGGGAWEVPAYLPGFLPFYLGDTLFSWACFCFTIDTILVSCHYSPLFTADAPGTAFLILFDAVSVLPGSLPALYPFSTILPLPGMGLPHFLRFRFCRRSAF